MDNPQYKIEKSEPITTPPLFPQSLSSTRKYEGVRFVAGEGKKPARVMFVATYVLEEEERDYQEQKWAKPLKEQPKYLKGPAGSVLKNITASAGVPVVENYYTALIKWLAPREIRLKPPTELLEKTLPLLMEEIREVQPDIIVCLGKPVFDLLSGTKYKLKDIIGGWFLQTLAERPRRLYPADCVTKLVSKPEKLEQFRLDMVEVSRMLRRIEGVYVEEYETNYRTIKTGAELEGLVQMLEEEEHDLLSVDCEWHGENYRVGQLRSLQICWAPGQAAYIRFMDDKLNYTFPLSYREVGQILGRWMNRPRVRYVGHHISADFPWMWFYLGLEWYGKTYVDTEFAQQCVDEAMDLGLERVGMAYTDMGRYDIDLVRWKKKNGKLCKGGYGLVPDEILINYACSDVDCVMRSHPHIVRHLQQEHGGCGWRYYEQILNPFVTDVFTHFAIEGLPIHRQRIDDLRDLYNWAAEELTEEFVKSVSKESENILRVRLIRYLNPLDGNRLWTKALDMVGEGDVDGAKRLVFTQVPTKHHTDLRQVWNHFVQAPTFNPNSSDQMRIWLFDVKGYIPIKSTNQKEKGKPSMDWSKVLELPESKQKDYAPAVDGQTLQILSANHDDDLLKELLRLKAVSTIRKSFLKQPIIDPQTGDLIEEKGLHQFLTPDSILLNNYSTTETGRPRSWRPNLLNLPSWVNKQISESIFDIVCLRKEQDRLPPKFEKYLDKTRKIPSLRSIVTAPDGWCVVESDYQTAELRGWAYISGDEDMIRLITEPDPHFARVKPEKMVDEDCVCRLSYPDFIPEAEQDPKWIMAYGVDGEIKARFESEDLLRDEDGNVVLHKQDLHWGLAELYLQRPREVLSKKENRGGAKAANFGTAYGTSENAVERKIEADTGTKPEPGTGAGLLDTLERRQKRAFEHMREMEEAPKNPGYLIAASGRIRHFHSVSRQVYDDDWAYEKQFSSQGREARNYFPQESVGATAARASAWLLKFGRMYRLQGRPRAVLYDSVVTVCPNEERKIWQKAHDLFMFLANGWKYHGRVLRYPIDHELNQGWSWKPTDSEKQTIEQTPELDDERARSAHEFLDRYIEYFKQNELASTLGVMDWALKQKETEDNE